MTEDSSSIMVPVSLSDEEQEINTDEKSEPVETETNVIENMEQSQTEENHVTKCSNEIDSKTGLDVTEVKLDLDARIEALEQERGQLTSEVMSKDNLITNLEKETSSLRQEVTELETNHANVVAEHERKFLLLSEEMSAKVAEVIYIFSLKIKR